MNRQDLQNLAEAYANVQEKKDSSYLETDMKKRQKNNEKARKDMEKMGTPMKNPHFEEAGADEKRMKKFQELQNNVDQKKKNIRGNDSAEQKARLEKKRGMKLDDHPQFKKEEVSGIAAAYQAVYDKEEVVDEAAPLLAVPVVAAKGAAKVGAKMVAKKVAKKVADKAKDKAKKVGKGALAGAIEGAKKGMKEEVIDEADSLAAMAARREKRLKAQRKKEGTTATGQDWGHDYGISSDERKKRQKAEFDAFVGRGKKKTNEEVEEVDEAMRPGPRQRAMAAKQHQQYRKGGGTYSSRDRATAHNVAVRNDGPGTPGYEKKSTGGKGARYAGYGDQGAGNKARRRMGEKPMRGNRDPRNEEFTSEDASMSPQETALQKKKLMVDLAIAKRRKQDLAKKSETPTKAMGEEASDAMKDRRMERGGVAGNVDYSKAPKPANTAGKKKPSGMSALDYVKAEIRKKHGKGALIDTKKK